jgi:anthranilate phosphoribosyltransferase
VVAKHGNRSVPPKTGSADVLEALGVKLDPSETQLEACFARARLAFLFAPSHHSAMRHAAPVRKAMGIRTIFNLLGPLSNPAGACRQVLGVFSGEWVEPYAEALRRLGAERAWVVHGATDGGEGIDEVSTMGPTRVAEATPSGVRVFDLAPEEMGLTRARLADLRGGSVETNRQALVEVLSGAGGPFADLVLANAGAVLTVAGRTPDIGAGVEQAREAIASGAARATLAALVEASNG